MTNELKLFFDQFEKLADSPGGVQKLRELILQLAVQGKLVPQDPNDEPASERLKKIKVEKEKLIKVGKIKKQKPLPPIESDEIPYKLPKGWEWVRLGLISYDIHYGYTASANHEHKDVRLLRITDIQSNTVNWNTAPGCEINQNDVGKYSLSNGDILIARTGGTIGKSYLVKDLSVCAVFASYLIRMLPCKGILPSYCKKFIESPLYWEQLYDKSMGTGQPNVNATSLKSLITPLPPLSEQKRIVAKVDELMALCDELEAKQEKVRHGRIVLNNSAIDHLLNAETTKDFDKFWQLICDNFDLLYDDSNNVDKLRQAILQLAVQGKLVSQDSNDEPASELLTKIRAEKEKLAVVFHHTMDKQQPPIEASDIAYQIPSGWEFVRIGDMAFIKGGKRLPKGASFSSVGTSHIYIRVTNMKRGTIIAENLKYINDEVYETIKRYTIDKNDLYITIAGTIGQSGLVPEKFHGMNLTENAAKLVFRSLDKHYALIALNSQFVQDQFQNKTKQMAQPKLALKRIASSIIPLPPLAEQKRIVAKVDELMALCDELEEKIKQSQDKSEKAMAATIHYLLVA